MVRGIIDMYVKKMVNKNSQFLGYSRQDRAVKRSRS